MVCEGEKLTDARKATVSDIPFMAALAREQYPQFTLENAEAWAAKVMALPNAAMFICGEAVSTVAAQKEFWSPDAWVADILPTFGRPTPENPLGTYKTLCAAAEWAKHSGCYGVRFGSSVGALSKSRGAVDLMEPFAKRMGAHPWGLTYMLEFPKCPPQYQ